MTAGQHRGAARRAGWLGIHPHEVDAFGGEAVDVRRLKTAHLLDRWNADLADRRVVPHDVDDVGRRAVLLSKLGEYVIGLSVFNEPPIAVLGLQNIVFRVVNDLVAQRCVIFSGHGYQLPLYPKPKTSVRAAAGPALTRAEPLPQDDALSLAGG